jgi:hypothetical protein
LLHMQDLSNGLDGCSVFLKIDLVKGYEPISLYRLSRRRDSHTCSKFGKSYTPPAARIRVKNTIGVARSDRWNSNIHA